MNTSPTTVMLDSEQSPPGLVELMRRELNKLIQRDAAMNENGVLTAAGCATATVTSQAKTTATAVYTVGGVFKSKAATDNLWTLAGTTVAVSSFQKYLLCLNAAGAASVIECVQASTAAGVTLQPYQVINVAVIGTLTVATDATHTFIPGTTLLGAAGITATFVDGFDTAMTQASLIKGLTPAGQG